VRYDDVEIDGMRDATLSDGLARPSSAELLIARRGMASGCRTCVMKGLGLALIWTSGSGAEVRVVVHVSWNMGCLG
jgi:hypothetical protein